MGLPGVISPLEVEFIALTTLVITGSRVHLVRVDQFFGFCGRFPSETNVREIKGYEIADLINLDLLPW